MFFERQRHNQKTRHNRIVSYTPTHTRTHTRLYTIYTSSELITLSRHKSLKPAQIDLLVQLAAQETFSNFLSQKSICFNRNTYYNDIAENRSLPRPGHLPLSQRPH